MFQIQKIKHLLGHKDSIYALASMKSEKTSSHELLSAGIDGYVVLWNLENLSDTELQEEYKQPDNSDILGKVIAKISGSIYALHIVESKKYLAVGHNTDGIHLIDLLSKNEIFSAGFTKSAIFDIKSIDNDLLVACGDGNIFVIDLEKLVLKTTLNFSVASARCIAICADKNEFAVGYSDNRIRIFSTIDYTKKHDFQAHTNSVFSLCYSADKHFLLSGGRDAHLKIWEIDRNYALYQDIVAHLFTINHIIYSPNKLFFATCSKDKSIKLWQADNFKLLKVIDKGRHAGHGTSINKLLWLDDNTLVSCSDDRTIVIWKVTEK